MIDRVAAAAQHARRSIRPLQRRIRYTTRRARLLPYFLIIGAQRAGTTTLFTYLRQHPDIEPPRRADPTIAWPKELHFFDENYWRGTDWYRAFFPLAIARRTARLRGHELICGEATPYYLFHPAVPERVAATLPDVRLIVLLRNPVERAYSHYQHMRNTARENLSFEEAIEAEPDRLAGLEEVLAQERLPITSGGQRPHHNHRHRAYVSRGLYADQLERWFAYFPREQFLVLRSEDFLARPAEGFAEVFAFLGVRPWRIAHYRARNIGSYAPISPDLRVRLEERFAEPNARLAEVLGQDFGWAPGTKASEAERRSA